MTDKTTKLLVRLTARQRKLILLVIKRLVVGDERGLDIKPIKGHQYVYRARVGDYRIIYRREDSVFTLIAIAKRDDRTYRDLN